MSLEDKLANLTLDDAPVVVETVKKEGVEKSGLAANASVLAARCASNDEKEALAAMKTVKALVEECPESQAFTKESLSACKCLLKFCVLSLVHVRELFALRYHLKYGVVAREGQSCDL